MEDQLFYLNYEGCKHVIRLIYRLVAEGFIWTMRDVNVSFMRNSSSVCEGFIWTMRDVNASKINSITNNNQFYLNYEGCKQTLTARPELWLFSFIWTMRDVNAACSVALHRSAQGFYLNYEGCKLLDLKYYLLNYFCFIWTMRDVNPCDISVSIHINAGFYLNYEGCKLWT